jgi:hypothetical protein
VSKRHVESFFETPPGERDAILSLLDQAREHASRNHAPSGYNIGINEGPGRRADRSAPSRAPDSAIYRRQEKPRGGVRWVIPDKADFWSPR